jgi:hypothetical protein
MAIFKEKVSTTAVGSYIAVDFVQEILATKQSVENGTLFQYLPSFNECRWQLFYELVFDYMVLTQLVVSQEFDIFKDSEKAKALSIIRGFYWQLKGTLESNGISIPGFDERLKVKQERARIAIVQATYEFENKVDVYGYLAAYFGNLLLVDCGTEVTNKRINNETGPFMHSFIASKAQFVQDAKQRFKIYRKEIEEYS